MNKHLNNSVGIDLGIKTLLTLSNGETIDNPRWTTQLWMTDLAIRY